MVVALAVISTTFSLNSLVVGVKVVDLTLTWEVAQVEDLTLVVAQAEDLILIWEEDNSKDNLLKKKFLIYLKTQMSNN